MGRLVLNLKEQVTAENENSIVVRDGDRLFVPSVPYEISVMGEVQFATSHLFNDKLNLKDYILRSGGYTANADENRVFAVKADGSVLTKGNTSSWFNSKDSRENLELVTNCCANQLGKRKMDGNLNLQHADRLPISGCGRRREFFLTVPSSEVGMVL